MHTNETTNQIAWIAYDNARAEGLTDTEALRARAAVVLLALTDGLFEGPAEHPASFSARSTARLFGVLA